MNAVAPEDAVRRLLSLIDRLSRDRFPIIAVAGLPAAGKSTVCAQVARLRPEVHVLSKDEIGDDLVRAAMARLGADPDDRDSDLYRRAVLPKSLELLAATAALAAVSGPVLVDTPFLEQAQEALDRDTPLAPVIGDVLGVRIDATVWLGVGAQEQRATMARRGADRDQVKLADFAAYRSPLDGLHPFPASLVDLHLPSLDIHPAR